MKRTLQGRYVKVSTTDETVRAFVPAPLPPRPPINWTPTLRHRFDAALLALGQLDGAASLLPESSLLLYSFVRKEAVLSSMIEGTKSSLSDLMLFELNEQPGVPLEDAREVSRYVAAMEHGIARVRNGFPVSSRLLREIHGILLGGGRGRHLSPGEFRRSQNWVGGTRPGNAVFVPPPAHEVADCIGQLERFLHDDPEPTPPLIKAALTHVQFETIHPFLDGNGRVGRLLVTLLLCEHGVLREPLLYLSLYFKEHRRTYYELLDEVRRSGNWELWLEFFANAVVASATQARDSARRILELTATDRKRVSNLGRASWSALELHRALERHPIATAGSLVRATGISAATVNKCLVHLERLGIVAELTQRRRSRIFSYVRYVEILNEGIGPVTPNPHRS